jgi:hypothetical protein
LELFVTAAGESLDVLVATAAAEADCL